MAECSNFLEEIKSGEVVLGIEFGSTRIKAVLIGKENSPICSGAYDWENALENGIWTYSLNSILTGLKECYADLKKNVLSEYGITLKKIKALGISAMMHGYLVFDKDDNLLVPFRTWRNTFTSKESVTLSQLFSYPIPERWSVAHLYHAIMEKENHVKNISFITTLAGFIHWKLTGQKVLGVGDASGMFPIDLETKTYNEKFLTQFNELVSPYNLPWTLKNILPKTLLAGENAGTLTKEGALLLDPTGDLEQGSILCPPEGDAGTGMVATNSVSKRTGNVSAGTSVFAMVVLEKELSSLYQSKIDLVTTPDGSLTAMAHANNCTGEYDSWLKIFNEVMEACGVKIAKKDLYDKILETALQGEKDCGGLVSYNYISGESITDVAEGRPCVIKKVNSNFSLSNFMRCQLFSALSTLRLGMDILFDVEKVKLDRLTCHGGFFKSQNVGLPIMASAMHTSVTVLENAGEGGAWGIAILASYALNSSELSLSEYLEKNIFSNSKTHTCSATEEDIQGFNKFLESYKKGLEVEKVLPKII